MRTKIKQINFRVTEREFILLNKKCKHSGMNMSDFLLNSSLNKKIIIIDGLKDFTSEIRQIGVNVNQLTKLCNEGTLTCINIYETKEELNKIWQSLNLLTQKAV